MAQRITKSLVDRMTAGDRLWDSDIKGFGVRHQGGTPCYVLKTRIHGRQRFISIGKHGSPWTVETARREALRLLSAAQHGQDLARTQEDERRRLALREVCEHYFRDYGPKLRQSTYIEYRRMFDHTILPAFGSRRLDDIRKSDVATFHSALAATPRKANFALAILSSCLSWALEHGYAAPTLPNPCRAIVKFRENARERYLNMEEMVRLLDTLDEVDRDATASRSVTTAIRLLLLTGARHGEILSLKWAYVDFERAMLWLPDSKTGRKPIHLNEQALDILRDHRRLPGNPYVITGRRHGSPLLALQKPWDMIRTRANLAGVRIHDLRHSFASVAINAGASLHMVGKLLGHAQPQTTARYAHLADDPLRAVNAQIGTVIAGARYKAANSR